MPSQGTATEPLPASTSTPSAQPSSATQTPPPTLASAPPEVEQTIARLASHKSVRGVMICSRDGPIIRQAGVVFEGEQGRKYATVIKRIVDTCKVGLEEINGGSESTDELKFMRVRTKKHELMITPDERYLLVVLQDPTQ
ncbi:hypothetical protein FRB99_003706 [Tulasnella sp. 403]|nr:hypothetical protein FRB99_003706 [Tulasnella sp. 403]